MTLTGDIERIARLAGDDVTGVIATEAGDGPRVYLCSFDEADGSRTWLGLRDDGSTVESRAELRAAISIAALCEVAADAAGGGDLDGLVASLEQLRLTEAPEGIELAEEAARELREVVGWPPKLASPARLDAIGAATRALERELDPTGGSPFASAMKSAQGAVSELQREVESGYRVSLA
jgi:hypothetical protein